MAEPNDASTDEAVGSAQPTGSLLLLATLVALPFVTKILVVSLGLTGWAWQSSYKVFQLAAPAAWRCKYNGKRGLGLPLANRSAVAWREHPGDRGRRSGDADRHGHCRCADFGSDAGD